MHFDPVGSEDMSSADLDSFDAEDLTVPETTPARSSREGLPKRFRMRHARHYVDELLGDAPLRTVREIPISEIEPPTLEPREDALDLDPLEGSIRRLGVLEPLLVIRRGLEYRVVAGMRRLRAARTVGLSTVPCLIQEADEEKAREIRDAVTSRLVAPVAPAPLVRIEDDVVETVAPPPPPAVIEPIEPGLRRRVLDDLAAAEALREKVASATRDMLSRPMTIDRTPSSAPALLSEAASAIALEARLRGVRVDLVGVDADAPISLDAARCRTAFTGLLQAMLALVDREGTTLEVHVQMTTVRPALIVDCRLLAGSCDLTIAPVEAADRFFDAEWDEHPAGAAGALCLAALMRVARAHGGRVQATHTGITFVVPRPLTDF